MPDRPPNILWYCTDQQRFDTIRVLGNPHVHTPHLDRFVAEGVAFTHAYCQSPICTPSRASFLTGLYPSRVHALRNGNSRVPPETAARLITKALADAGYDGGLVGKLHLAAAAKAPERRVDDGYRYFQYSHAPRNDWRPGEHQYADWLRAKGHDPAHVLTPKPGFGGLMIPTRERDNVPPELHQTAWCTEQTIEFITHARAPDRPWFVSVNPYDPHPPYNPPWEFYRRYDPATLPGPHFRPSDLAHQARLAAAGVDFQSAAQRPEEFQARELQAAYYAMIELVDEQFGRLLEALAASGQAQHTVVIFTSDHGEAAGDYGLTQKGCRFFDGLTRVPLVWRWPGHFPAGRRSDALVELTDLAPTILELAGLPRPADLQGRSLLPILTGAAPLAHHRDFVRSEYVDAVNLPNHTYATMYRDRRWKLNVYHGCGVGELFDLEGDPFEHVSLWDSPAHQAIKHELLVKSFDATVLATDPGPPRISNY
ncbi:MAG: sulfatase-like hydrolase/transferase [Actinobacteria bacterium]|nr:sulfatase-like hydrolase/transferase [Actinomycetota bacterium]